ncbi:hypothetical protein [Streptomyces sp. WG5]|uniref:hypothetical protein n=1 Tax=Streptomyces sp. WG5 TaxID=3417648 RepID=UPI003CF5C833
MEAFGRLKAVFDPLDRMNPGKVVAPYGLDENLRLGGDWAPYEPRDLHFRFPHDGGSFSRAANRCVGAGKCRQHTSDGTVMCPSYQVTREEEHSTRGRARLLFEMLDGDRAAVAGHLHQPFPPAHRTSGGTGAGARRLAGGADGGGR